METIPDYITERVRQWRPSNLSIIPGSTPVLAFGNFRTANVATLGLNPGKVEFLGTDGNELTGVARRLATLNSLQCTNLSDTSAETVAQIVADCELYFQRNPYRRWFDQLEPILKASGSSYYDGTACHLDLVQWATDPTWSGLSKQIRNQLIQGDSKFLMQQLKSERLNTLLVNGRGVYQELATYFQLDDIRAERISGHSHVDTELFSAMLFGRLKVVGWSTNIQSSFGVTNALRSAIAQAVHRRINAGSD